MYTRQLGQVFGSASDVGSLAADVDGIIRHTARGLPTGIVHVFAVSAYDAFGRESLLSNELSLLVPFLATPTRTATPAAATPSRTPTIIPTGAGSPNPTATPADPSGTATAIPGTPVSVSGSVRYYAGGGAVPDVTLTLQGPLGMASAATDGDGQFSFGPVGGGIWQLAPHKQGDVQNAVTSLDAAYILQVLSGMRSFDTLQTLACDVTGNGAISALDATRILQLAVSDLSHFALAELCDSDWLFVPKPQALPLQQIINPLINICQPGAIAFLPLLNNAEQQDFEATVLGDCTGNWRAFEAAQASLRLTAPAVRAQFEEARLRPGSRWLVPLDIEGPESALALSVRFAYDPTHATLVSVDGLGASDEHMLRYRDDGYGLVTIALASAEPLRIGERPLIRLVFDSADEPLLWLLDVVVDDAEARVVN